MSKEHSGLLSWPESFRRSRGSLGLAAEMPGGLSSRALQLSMYGSMVSLSSGQQGHRRLRRHRVQATTTNQKHSSSYPRMPSKERPLLSVQSEGSNMKRVAALPLRDAAEVAATAPAPAAQQQRRRKAMYLQEEDNSSDDSAGEEVIVRVDSPSMLSFRQSATAPPPQDQ